VDVDPPLKLNYKDVGSLEGEVCAVRTVQLQGAKRYAADPLSEDCCFEVRTMSSTEIGVCILKSVEDCAKTMKQIGRLVRKQCLGS